MTLHTRIAVTSPGVDARAAFDHARDLIGATDRYVWREDGDGGYSMQLGQGLPALMWVDVSDGQPEQHDDWCEPDCSGEYHDLGHYVMVHFDTGYAYTAPNGASCSDLHAWLVDEMGRWLTERGATWEWYDESGDGWNHGDGWGTLGSPEVGRIGSQVVRIGRDEKRDFGTLALAAIVRGFEERRHD